MFLAQFEPVAEGQKPTVTRLTAREIDQWREDYEQGVAMVSCNEFQARTTSPTSRKCVDGTVLPPPSESALRDDVLDSTFRQQTHVARSVPLHSVLDHVDVVRWAFV